MSYNRCKDIHKFGNKYLPLSYKTQVEFRSHFSGKKVHLMVREIRYIITLTAVIKLKRIMLLAALEFDTLVNTQS